MDQSQIPIGERPCAPIQVLPSLLTLMGHLLSLLWLLGGPMYLGVLGLLCDAADGAAARRLGVCSEWGSLYDWTVDVTMAALVVAHLHGEPALLVLVPLQVELRRRGFHLSGRTFLVLAAMGRDLLMHWAVGSGPG